MTGTAKKASSKTDQAVLMVNLYGGDRKPVAEGTDVLLRVHDGFQKELVPARDISKPNIRLELPFAGGIADNMTVLVSAHNCFDVGFSPVKISPLRITDLDLILVKKKGSFVFEPWASVQKREAIANFLGRGLAPGEVERKYEQFRADETKQPMLACLLNLTVAMSQIHLPRDTPLDYFKLIDWDQLAQDRFFAYADKSLVDQVRMAADQHLFAPEPSPKSFHKGATSSFKQIEFGEANVQLTFHENDKKRVDNTDCILVEPDIDYFKDLAAHTVLEVIPNAMAHQLTDPRQVYILRWIAGQRAGMPAFEPPYVIN